MRARVVPLLVVAALVGCSPGSPTPTEGTQAQEPERSPDGSNVGDEATDPGSFVNSVLVSLRDALLDRPEVPHGLVVEPGATGRLRPGEVFRRGRLPPQLGDEFVAGYRRTFEAQPEPRAGLRYVTSVALGFGSVPAASGALRASRALRFGRVAVPLPAPGLGPNAFGRHAEEAGSESFAYAWRVGRTVLGVVTEGAVGAIDARDALRLARAMHARAA